ncbi:2-hydroxychromene-2-carboxylate isomerase [Lacisediminimonas profundi]|uniref:2-hydroxychromene-2-carboxylate isomerase n=1 Tax=Lacisediminimonas profundi TaxID=2603856 RepID=UPI00124B2AD8|nr:2-hydroxychromene-2-carboxylate isomerase [Lacisediminimonas profundi]
MSSSRPRIEYYFSFVSLWSYIGSEAFAQLVKRHNAEVIYKPIDLHAIFKAGGGLPVTQRPPQRQAYRFVEMQRWRDIRGIPLVLKPKHHPSNPEIGHRMLLAALAQGQDVTQFVHNALKVLWVDDLNVEDPAVMVAVADKSGLDGAALLEASNAAERHAEVQQLTDEAVERKVFGTPFYMYRDEPFWGQDRLDLLDAAITSQRPAVPFKLI